MKSIRIFVFFIAVFALFSSCAILQKSDGFQGVITYEINYEIENLSAMEKAQLPTEITVYISDNMIRQDQSTAFYSISQIHNFNDDSVIMLFEGMGQKFAVKQTKEEADEMEKIVKEMVGEIDDPEIKLIDETKEILGYRSKKAEVMIENEIFEAFYTEELKVPEKTNEILGLKGINGLLMEFSIIQEDIVVTRAVKDIKRSRVPAHTFRIPDDYEITTFEELGMPGI